MIKGVIIILRLLENVQEASVLLLLICAFFYYRHLQKTKRVRKLSVLELSMLFLTPLAYLLWAGSYLLIILDNA
ncbi:hypothetical protein [Bacillus sp. N1-1]|jgi:hypothetical protein|uniref:hypothetical protein n=1 Tax=Bacillus sp. N1-1 TaxID=2682541 RepID=UPI001F0D4537|nr:hypothetical protein [Bacillus sp. N1-1]